jgi:glycerol kinase
MVGLTRFITKGHIARAALESVAFQVRDVLAAMEADGGTPLRSLHVDGGVTRSELMMQFQSDLLRIPVTTPHGADSTTALGAAFAAGIGAGVYVHYTSSTAWCFDSFIRGFCHKSAST